MGQAKQKAMGRTAIFQELEAEFAEHGIDTSKFGFYDQEAFLAQEQISPDYLEKYAKWVLNRPTTKEYNEKAKIIVPKVAGLVAQALQDDGINGGCTLAAGLLTRVLDRLGIWSFALCGSANFETKSPRKWRGLHSCDFEDFPGAELGHSWVCAPPYNVVDASARTQRWGDDEIKNHIPSVILDTEGCRTRPELLDIVSVAKQQQYRRVGRLHANLHYDLEPRLRKFGSTFPALKVVTAGLTSRYIPVAVRMSDCSLDFLNSESGIGRSGKQIWDEVIAPAFNI